MRACACLRGLKRCNLLLPRLKLEEEEELLRRQVELHAQLARFISAIGAF